MLPLTVLLIIVIKKNKTYKIMKKQLLLFSLLFTMLLSFAQEVTEPTVAADTTKKTEEVQFCPHRVSVKLGGGLTNNIYKRVPAMDQKYSFGNTLEVGYTYFFNENWGLGLGVGLQHIAAKALLDINGQTIVNEPGYYDDPARSYTMFFKTTDFVEKQSIWAIEVPLTAQYEYRFGNKRNGIYAGLGVKGYFPIKAKTSFSTETGELTLTGREEEINVDWNTDLEGHFGIFPVTAKSTLTKLRPSIDIQADFGGVFGLSRRTDFYIGAYCSYGFLNILPKETSDYVSFDDSRIVINGTMASNTLTEYNKTATKPISEKWNLFQFGIKTGFHFKTCKGYGKDAEYMDDLKRRFMNKMMEKSNDPIIIKTTEYVYIVPVTPTNIEEEDKKTQDNIQELAEALSNTKILFDLDKDIPKITDNNDNVKKTIEILKKDKSLALIVEGYTCDLGSEAHNRDLAQRRAIAIRQMFINQGVSPDQISIASYTYNDPQNKLNIPDDRREEHRAAIFRIIKK